MTILALSKINKGYGKACVIATVSTCIDNGLHLIEGANGTGKTTLLEIVAGLIRPTSGAVLIDGVDLAKRKRDTVRRLAYAPAQATFLDNITVDVAVRLYLALRGIDPGKDPLEAFDPFSLSEQRATMFANLSLGWQKRVVLHMAFAASADVLVLDEPTVGLDVDSVDVVRSLMQARAEGQVTIFTCHDPALLALDDVHRYRLNADANGSILTALAPTHP